MICPKCGQNSTDPEFCSECGVKMDHVDSQPTQTGPVMQCPICSEIRDSVTTRFCENCRYDFVDGKSYTPPPADPEPEPEYEPALQTVVIAPIQAPVTPAPAVLVPELIPLDACLKWELTCKVDPSLCQAGDPTPTDLTEKIFPVLFEENLIGKRSDSKGIHPEIRIDDPGISRKHALLKKHTNGALSIIDLDSTNGTEVNGTTIKPNVDTPLKNGDVIVLGCWSRILVVGTN